MNSTTTDVYPDKIPAGSNNISARTLVCHFCNATFDIEEVHCGEQVGCPQCEQTLIRIELNPVTTPIIYGFLALFSFILLLIFPLLDIVIPVVEDATNITILGVFKYLSLQDYMFLSFIFILFVLITPLLFIFITLYVYGALYLSKNWPMLKEAAHILGRLRPWIMADIFFISVIVSLVKIKALADIHFGYTMVILFGYSIFLARIVLSISDYWLHDKLAILEKRVINYREKTFSQLKKDSRVKIHFSWALLLTAVVFYIPANVYPMMITEGIGFHYESNIIEGVIEIWSSGDYFVASVIFVASFLIPIIKIFILFIILLAISYKKVLSPKNLTKCYVIIEKIGRWSMIDVFVIMLMTSLFTSSLISILPGLSVNYFFLVVVITMVATSIIDTRLLWADERR